MNIDRFAGDNKILQNMAQQMRASQAKAQAQQAEIAKVMERQRQRDVAAAAGVSIPFNVDDIIRA